MRLADYVFSMLADRGVRHVFMVSGGGAMFLNDALGKEKRIRTVCTHHEQGAAIAAEGSFRVDGSLSVVSVTTGPGGTNAMTGLIGEWLDSQSVLFLSGQVKFPTTIAAHAELGLRQFGDQEINIIDLVRPVTKYAVMVTDPLKIRYELEKAIFLACSGRPGPVWLDIPIDVQSAEIDPAALEGFPVPDAPSAALPDETLRRIAASLCASKSPAVIGGQGVRLAHALPELRELLDLLRIPLLSTFGAFDYLPSTDPRRIGPIGTIGTRGANIVLQNADFILCIGSRNNIRQASYNYENFAKSAKEFVWVDIDPAEIRKETAPVTIPVEADAGVFLRGLLSVLKTCRLPDFSKWLSWAAERRDLYDPVLPAYRKAEGGVHPYVFTRLLTDFLPEGAAVVSTNATPSIMLFQAGTVKRDQRMFANSGCAAMGYGLPASIGAAFALRGGGPVICLEGDGSLMMNMQELQTMHHHDLPVKLFLYNNNEYCSIRQTQDRFFEGRHTGCDNASGVTFPDWRLLAAAFSLPYFEIASAAEAEAVIPRILKEDGPAFCNVKLVPGYVFSPKLSSRVLEDGRIVSPSLEDMHPFLSHEEMERNIYRA